MPQASEESIWCDECGAALPWKHTRVVTPRRRLITPLSKALTAIGLPFMRAAEALIVWADRPGRARYDAKRDVS